MGRVVYSGARISTRAIAPRPLIEVEYQEREQLLYFQRYMVIISSEFSIAKRRRIKPRNTLM